MSSAQGILGDRPEEPWREEEALRSSFLLGSKFFHCSLENAKLKTLPLTYLSLIHHKISRPIVR